jgi:glycosyltransferase involved in cell wall biosynthesis
MTPKTKPAPVRVVVAHRSARDNYEAARAVEEAGLLESLVTDLYWPADRLDRTGLDRLIPGAARNALSRRSNAGLPSAKTVSCGLSGLVSLAFEKAPVPFPWRQRAVRWADATIGKHAGRLASRRDCALLSYSYYAHSAFSNYTGSRARILFQLHPHPESVRRILLQELADHPECAVSLAKEWEMSLPPADFERLVEETGMADRWIAASSFTRQTLTENGVPGEHIAVVPYGVDLNRFTPGKRSCETAHSQPLRLLFAGTINQRKGVAYLAQALRLFGRADVELRICGRVVDDLQLFEPFGSQVRITPLVSGEELIEAYREADVFVLPSVAEGFGHVLLESLACGTPVLSTTSTAAPDLIDDGEQGFVVPPRDGGALADRLEWCLRHRGRLAQMRKNSRERAERFSWERFRSGIASVLTNTALDNSGQNGNKEPERMRQACV